MARRSLLDRIFLRLKPAFDPSFEPPPRELAPGLWSVDRRLRLPPALRLPTRMSVLGLGGNGLLLVSPVPIDAPTRAALDALGRVVAIVAPNSFHYLYAAAALEEFPEARFFVASDLVDRIPELPPAIPLGEEAPALWAGAVEQRVFGPVGNFVEVVLFHRPSRALVLTDLAFHMRSFESPYQRLAWRLSGVPRELGPSLTARLTLLRDRAGAGPLLRGILDWDFQRIVVAHGEVVERHARQRFVDAYRSYLGEADAGIS